MTRVSAIGYLLVAALVVAAGPAAALSVGAGGWNGPATAGQASVDAGGVGVGQQLATVVSAESEAIRGAVDREAFEVRYEDANDSERVELLADRADRLADRAEAIGEDYRAATDAYREGDLNESAYAQRIAVLNARAERLLAAVEQFRNRTANVSTIDLRAAGLNGSEAETIGSELDAVVGTGPRALLERFTGDRTGELEIESRNGSVEIAVEGDGERSREVERDPDGNDSLTVGQSAALDTARAALSDAPGDWTLVGSGVDADDGTYEFEFELRGANATGEAEIEVDGSSGTVIGLEEEVEPVDTDDREDDEEDDDRDEGDEEDDGDEDEDDEGDEGEDRDENEDDREPELSLIVADGTPGPGETVTVRVLVDGEPTENVTVRRDDAVAGTTGPDGTVAVTLSGEETTVEAEYRDAEAELEFEFEAREDPVLRNLSVEATLDAGTVTLAVTYDGAGLADATVEANGDRVGTTDADGSITFDTGVTEELELEIVKGEFEVEYEYDVENGSLVLVETPDGAGSDDREREDEDDEEEEGDEDGDDESEEDEDDEGDEDEGDEDEDDEGDEDEAEEDEAEDDEDEADEDEGEDDEGDEAEDDEDEAEDDEGDEDEADEDDEGDEDADESEEDEAGEDETEDDEDESEDDEDDEADEDEDESEDDEDDEADEDEDESEDDEDEDTDGDTGE